MSALQNNPLALLKALVVRIPLILRTLVYHALQATPASKKQDLRTEMTVAIIRSLMDTPLPVTVQQRRSMRDPGIKGPMWVSKVTLPAPGEAVAEAVLRAIESLSDGNEAQGLALPTAQSVEGEWTGYRAGVDKSTPLPGITEKQKYEALKAEATSDLVILYIHGGALFLMDPCTHRVPVAHICKLTGARAFNVRYRLAPQNPFPAALVDVLTAYLSLIYPPEGSYHEPIPANKIVLAGDSAGGNLSLALLQTLLTLKRASSTITFHGREVAIEIPAGLSLMSPWCDITRSMQSVQQNAIYDYLSPPPQPTETIYHPSSVEDSVWPANPPRSDMYCNASLVAHPLVSPLASTKELWKGAPPIYMTVGEEGLTDEILLTARKIHHAGAPVIVEQYEGMPHVFGFIIMGTAASKLLFQGWAQYLRDLLAGSILASREDVGKLIFHNSGWSSTKVLSLDEVSKTSDAEVERILRNSRNHRTEWEVKLKGQWQAKARL